MKSTRILVIDDDAAVLHALRRVLEPLYTLRCTSSPQEAAGIAAQFDPDIAICDVQMPHISGFELLDKLRAAARDVDVILMTGSITDQDTHLIRALRERAFYFILKPFEREVLLALVERCEEMQRLRRAERDHLTRMRDELLAAQVFQQAMLAPAHDEVAGARVDVLWQPCTEVGGDFYDYAVTPAGDLAFIVADVRGHGVPAALMTATVKTLFRAEVIKGGEPSALAATLIDALRHFGEDQFMTAFCGRVAGGGRRLEYVNAGHPAGALLGENGTMHLLHATAPLLSPAVGTDEWPADEAALPARWRLLVHTDGFSGGMRDTHGEWADMVRSTLGSGASGQARLKTLAESGMQPGAPPAHAADDVTLMLIESA